MDCSLGQVCEGSVHSRGARGPFSESTADKAPWIRSLAWHPTFSGAATQASRKSCFATVSMFQLAWRGASWPLPLPDMDTFLLTWLCKATPTTRGTLHRQLLVLGPSNERACLLLPYRWIPHNMIRGRRLSFRSFQQRDAVQPLARSSRRRLAARFGQFLTSHCFDSFPVGEPLFAADSGQRLFSALHQCCGLVLDPDNQKPANEKFFSQIRVPGSVARFV